jgi:tetratricopeptide (TPR) repeat protein
MRNLFLWLAVFLLFGVVNAQSLLEDDTNIDAYLERFADGIVTESMVADLKTQATAAFDGGNCQNAIPLLETWATQSNTLANLYRQTLRPFYRSTRMEREDSGFSISNVDALIENESKSNNLIQDRNTAWVYLGECYAEAGDNALALGYFSQALDIISVGAEEVDLWNRAALGIMSIINQ